MLDEAGVPLNHIKPHGQLVSDLEQLPYAGN
jgi:hypothetical protein